ncbi:hypothetical protein AXF42_Ash009715 [Apostasia shenzhenica]|uniref:Uncharacterized protein n=1 Tax=Apostasia shenzhenica TaxID=1088818 RepID=A0A2I0AWW9_9ASPA|nr:hypothetical protein AXF42_Ash009715 [Apostasia shenzhenica]
MLESLYTAKNPNIPLEIMHRCGSYICVIEQKMIDNNGCMPMEMQSSGRSHP